MESLLNRSGTEILPLCSVRGDDTISVEEIITLGTNFDGVFRTSDCNSGDRLVVWSQMLSGCGDISLKLGFVGSDGEEEELTQFLSSGVGV